MGLFDFRTPKDKLDLVKYLKDSFNFLMTDFGFNFVGSETPENYRGKYLIIYRSDNSKIQLELCASETWFHCEFRRLIDGHPAKYSDKENSIGFEKLAVLESNNNYEHLDYFAGGSEGIVKALMNTATLFKRNKTFFTTDIWLDTKRIEQLEDDEFQAKFGFKPSDNKNKPTFFEEFKKESTFFLTSKGFNLIVDSSELPPFDTNSMVENIIYAKGNTSIKLAQQDWRDYYYIYNIEKNGKRMFQININEHQNIEEAVLMTMDALKQFI